MRSSPSKRSVRRAGVASKRGLSERSLSTAYQLKVTLHGAKPPIWRRIHVRSSTTLGELHDVIQTAMGWTNTHLHEFDVDGARYAAPNEIYDDPDPDVIDARSVLLGDVVPVGGKFTYTYDFGDDWRTMSLSRSSWRWSRMSRCPDASVAVEAVHPRTSGVSGATPSSSRHGATRIFGGTRRCATGLGPTSTRKRSTPTR